VDHIKLEDAFWGHVVPFSSAFQENARQFFVERNNCWNVGVDFRQSM